MHYSMLFFGNPKTIIDFLKDYDEENKNAKIRLLDYYSANKKLFVLIDDNKKSKKNNIATISVPFAFVFKNELFLSERWDSNKGKWIEDKDYREKFWRSFGNLDMDEIVTSIDYHG